MAFNKYNNILFFGLRTKNHRHSEITRTGYFYFKNTTIRTEVYVVHFDQLYLLSVEYRKLLLICLHFLQCNATL